MNQHSKKKPIIELCRENRKNMTEAEQIVWGLVRNRKLDGKKFLRQHPFAYENTFDLPKFFIADFYCAEEKLVVELDGKIHEFQKEYDLWRTSVINELGMRILRINNEDAFDENLVTNRIRSMFTKLTPRPPLFKKRGGDSPFQTSF